MKAGELSLTHDTHSTKVFRISPVSVIEERLDINVSPHNFEIFFSFPNFLMQSKWYCEGLSTQRNGNIL